MRNKKNNKKVANTKTDNKHVKPKKHSGFTSFKKGQHKYIKGSGKTILDACCGSKMCWFDKNHPAAIYADIRKEKLTICDGREVIISPDVRMDFRNMPFEDETFKLVLFDPPHLTRLGEKSWMAAKYGVLSPTWETDIKAGFDECMRVMQPDGILIFKWSEVQVTLNQILNIIKVQPLFGHTSGKHGKTIWLCFRKS